MILKEGRRHGETNWDGCDGFTRIEREASVLRALSKVGVGVPEIVRQFSYEGNRYLVLKKLSGKPLLRNELVQPQLPSVRRAAQLLAQLDPVLAAIHMAGWVWRDCKPQHILVSGANVQLIDFEGACRIDAEGILPWGSPDYMPPAYRKPFAFRKAGTLEDDYALGVIAFQFLAGDFPSLRGRERARVYRRTACPDALRDRIEGLLALD
ncbi:MAG: hypothetical protein M3Y80_07955 [Verrucomicrobiota bacterium]|nr:hypothetical protein [Verrucomicrobiota bacterium]